MKTGALPLGSATRGTRVRSTGMGLATAAGSMVTVGTFGTRTG